MSITSLTAHELGHWYYLLLAISQNHIFTIAFLHAPPVRRSFDFSKELGAQPPTIVAFPLFQMILTPSRRS
jgi:STE24 endopeptidase